MYRLKLKKFPFYLCEMRGVCFLTYVHESEKLDAQQFLKKQATDLKRIVEQMSGMEFALEEIV